MPDNKPPLSLHSNMLERPEAVYYVEQKAKIGTVEVALKPNTEVPFSLQLTSSQLQV